MIAAGSGLAVGAAPSDAALEASLDAMASSGADHADLVLVFVSGVRSRARPPSPCSR